MRKLIKKQIAAFVQVKAVLKTHLVTLLPGRFRFSLYNAGMMLWSVCGQVKIVQNVFILKFI